LSPKIACNTACNCKLFILAVVAAAVAAVAVAVVAIVEVASVGYSSVIDICRCFLLIIKNYLTTKLYEGMKFRFGGYRIRVMS